MASKDTAIAAAMEQLMAEGPQAMGQVMTMLMNLAMRMERDRLRGPLRAQLRTARLCQRHQTQEDRYASRHADP